MKTLADCVVASMDGSDGRLFPYLPYIMQDLWGIGSSPETIVALLQRYGSTRTKLKVLDLGCGKGLISIEIAKIFKCHCYGIDAIQEFIEEARQKAKEHDVWTFCTFEVGDIRSRISELKNYDVIVLGSIGPVLGDYYSTLTLLANCLSPEGVVVLDDGYLEENNGYSHPDISKKPELLKQIDDAGMELLDEVIMDRGDIRASNNHIFEKIDRRCRELITQYPNKKALFKNYVERQKEENEVLESKMVCSAMLLGQKL